MNMRRTLVNSACPASGITEADLMGLDAEKTAVAQSCATLDGTSFTFTQETDGHQKSAEATTSKSKAAHQSVIAVRGIYLAGCVQRASM